MTWLEAICGVKIYFVVVWFYNPSSLLAYLQCGLVRLELHRGCETDIADVFGSCFCDGYWRFRAHFRLHDADGRVHSRRGSSSETDAGSIANHWLVSCHFLCSSHFSSVFRCVLASLYEGLSVRPYVRGSVCPSVSI